ncbi:MAG: recombination mediator RecR [Candidatus Muiribacteriaceae bacterium]
MNQSELVRNLIMEFAKLPSIGKKTAQRLTYHILALPDNEALGLARAIQAAKSSIGFCEVCFNYCEDGRCDICQDNSREEHMICVVEDPKDIAVIESTGEFHGRYHILHGLISPLKGQGPDDIRIKELIERLSDDKVKEVLIAFDFSVEADATSLYLSRLIRPLGVSVTRLASGIPAGASLEYADTVTLTQAIKKRTEV